MQAESEPTQNITALVPKARSLLATIVLYFLTGLAFCVSIQEVLPGFLSVSTAMPYYEFIWTDAAIEHLDEHDISPGDFEDVVSHPLGVGKSRSSGLPVAFGYVSDGRYVMAVYKMLDEMTVQPVTAYEVNEPQW